MRLFLIRQRIKPWVLPIAMLAGVLFHDFMEQIAFIAPYLIFVMLFITFCKVTPKEFKVTPMVWALLAVQFFGSLAAYFAFLPAGEDVAQGAFISVFCPTATAAPVITGMLGGNVARLATYSIVSNLTVALTAPVLFSWLSPEVSVSFLESSVEIGLRVVPLIFLPLLLAFFLLWKFPKVHHMVSDRQSISFYIWALSLFIVVGRAVSFVMAEPADKIPEMIVITLASALVCCLQFYIGRKIGRRYGDKISGAQGLGQKNTVLAIWMALTYLNPISSVGPAAYVAWQNIINSTQLYLKSKRDGI